MKRISAILLTAALLGLTACGRGEPPEAENAGNYRYARLAETELDERTAAFVDIYYENIVKQDGVEYYDSVSYLVVQDKDTGRTLATSRISTGLAGQGGALSPREAYMKPFELGGERVIAVTMPIGENNTDELFFHYQDDMFGLCPCPTDNGFYAGFDIATMEEQDGRLTDGTGNTYEFDFEKYPAYVTISS